MSFTDQKPWTVTAKDIASKWGVSGKGSELLRCAWCGYRFVEGDTARLVYTNSDEELCQGINGNPFICVDCDGPREDILAKLQELKREVQQQRFWWFL